MVVEDGPYQELVHIRLKIGENEILDDPGKSLKFKKISKSTANPWPAIARTSSSHTGTTLWRLNSSWNTKATKSNVSELNFCDAYLWIRYLAKGTIKCPNFSQENDPDEWDLSSTKYDKDEPYDAEGLKFIKAKGHPMIRDKLEVRIYPFFEREITFLSDIRKASSRRLCEERLPSRIQQRPGKEGQCSANHNEHEKGWDQQASRS